MAAITHTKPRALEHRGEGTIRRKKSDNVIGAALEWPRRQVHEKPFGAADVARHNDVYHPSTRALGVRVV
jgi:hypothetical protein